MDLEDIYENIENNDIKDTTKPRTLNHSQDEGKDQKCRGNRCLVLMTVCLGIICVVLLVYIIAQHISNTAERESYKNTAEEFNQTINRLQAENTELMTEKDQLKNNFSSLSQKNLEIETELRKLNEQCKVRFNISSVLKSWSDSRQYCRDHGGDLVIINTEEKQRLVSSFVKERVWIGLSDIMNEGNMKWVDNSPLKQGFWEINEPNDADENEDCIELNPAKPVLNNWNDIPCSEMRKCVCEN